MSKFLDVKNKILLFDLDGTLVDTEKLAEKVIRQYCIDKNLFHQAEKLKSATRSIIGRTWKAAVSEMIRSHQLTLDPQEFENDLKKHYLNMLYGGVDSIPGVHEKLPLFKSKSIFMGIVTGSGKDEVQVILDSEKVAHLFDQIWASEHYHESKPSPQPYQIAFEEIQKRFWDGSGQRILPEDVIIFEDSVAGMESAHCAGFGFVQVLHAHPHAVPDPRALFTIQDWRDLRIG